MTDPSVGDAEPLDAATRPRIPALSRRRLLGRWRWLVPVVCVLAGFMFATSARTSRGTELRSPETSDLADLVRAAEAQVDAESATLAAIQAQVSGETGEAGRQNSAVATAQAAGATLQEPGGLTAVEGPGILVVLDDAATLTGTTSLDANESIVHQSDLQAVVNALWAGGAEAMTVAGQRIIATSAVRCVGNTLLLNGRVFSPPYRVAAIGSYVTMRAALDDSAGVTLFKQAASYYGLGYTVEQVNSQQLPAYDSPITLSYAKVQQR
ncbi:MAG TPA: DUF881 domain-containing protein [Jatrophihabitantaceae bacterium]|jgi:uncharacterized protein YlxW (UPF0749 family)|nr:DUF881 domain-containing protein [Jatrophihabitantaceae bacterium]